MGLVLGISGRKVSRWPMTSFLVNGIALPADSFDAKDIRSRLLGAIGISEEGRRDLMILKRSIDARKKPDISVVYSVKLDVDPSSKSDIKLLNRHKNAQPYKGVSYAYEDVKVKDDQADRPVVIGAGPAGLFCAYLMARAGLRPIILERGKSADQRYEDVKKFWETGILDPESNVAFGEGGAGTFSDGKLNTLNKDHTGRMRYILRTFAQFGAPESILYDGKPHIGTDTLLSILPAMREYIISCGGEYRFNTKVTGFITDNGRLCGVHTASGETIECKEAVLATGHGASDIYESLGGIGIPMEAKPFAVGFRVEHPQSMINISQYGTIAADLLPAASYKLVTHCGDRGVFSFCMCPGGYVVDSSSDENGLVVNGMSYSDRRGSNANSAIVVSVDAADFGGNDPFSAIAFQKDLEKRAKSLAQGSIPQQLLGDYRKGQKSSAYGDFESAFKGRAAFSDLRGLLSGKLEGAFLSAMDDFGKKIEGFDRYDTILSGVESRTSSPVRVIRGEDLMSPAVSGLYPCGEGAGYAGGIMSAAADGLKVAERLIGKRDYI